MRIKRKKHCDKYLAFYRNKFKIHEPYQIIVDLTFCQEALQNRVQIKDQLTRYLSGSFKLFNTSCILSEGKELGPKLHGAVVIAEKFETRNCGHERTIPANACLASLVKRGNEHGLFIATQDSELRDSLRKKPGIPLLHVNHNVIVLEKPSSASVQASDKQDSKRLISEHERDMLKLLKKTENPGKIQGFRKRKGPKGPNPLSVKKKRKIEESSKDKTEGTAKKRRKRNKKKKSSSLDI